MLKELNFVHATSLRWSAVGLPNGDAFLVYRTDREVVPSPTLHELDADALAKPIKPIPDILQKGSLCPTEEDKNWWRKIYDHNFVLPHYSWTLLALSQVEDHLPSEEAIKQVVCDINLSLHGAATINGNAIKRLLLLRVVCIQE